MPRPRPTNRAKRFQNRPNVQRKERVIKRALLIGINYTGTKHALSGCINDSHNLKDFLVKSNYFKQNEIIMMNDKIKGGYYPSRRNIEAQFRNLVSFANKHRSSKVLLFVSYSGHGSYMIDRNGDEKDGKDEVLCPIDCDRRGYIKDDFIKAQLINRLPSNVKLVMMVDACHSGTMCDLKFDYDKNNLGYSGSSKKSQSKCDVVMISGCMDSQTSADAYLRNKGKFQYQGAMTASFLANYHDNISYYDLLTKMRKWLKNRSFDQIPQLSSGKLINIRKPFLLGGFD